MNAPGTTQSDRWTGCASGHLHWGAQGGAGLLLRCAPERGKVLYLLVQRSRWVDHGGTWGIPGGALHEGETAESGARRGGGGGDLARSPASDLGRGNPGLRWGLAIQDRLRRGGTPEDGVRGPRDRRHRLVST